MDNTVMMILGSALIVGAVVALFFVLRSYKRTGGKKFKIDFKGQERYYENAKDLYRPGERVRLIYGLVATDTRYTFMLDGSELNCDYDDDKGYIVSFVMPAHDVSLECLSKNLLAVDDQED